MPNFQIHPQYFKEGGHVVRTPEELAEAVLGDGWRRSSDWREDLYTLANLIHARDAEVAKQVRAETLAGFTEERGKFWEHDEGTGRLRRASTGVVCTRLVGPYECEGGEQS